MPTDVAQPARIVVLVVPVVRLGELPEDVRGKFSSDGDFDPGVHEVDDG